MYAHFEEEGEKAERRKQLYVLEVNPYSSKKIEALLKGGCMAVCTSTYVRIFPKNLSRYIITRWNIFEYRKKYFHAYIMRLSSVPAQSSTTTILTLQTYYAYIHGNLATALFSPLILIGFFFFKYFFISSDILRLMGARGNVKREWDKILCSTARPRSEKTWCVIAVFGAYVRRFV